MLCDIMYSEEYKDVMTKLRGFLEQKTYTEEALALTEKALELLAAHYTTWHYRFNIVKAIKRDLFEELDWCELVALENEKNYQIWHYRQLIIEEILKDEELASKFDFHREYPILSEMLQEDSKNHHVWSYRKWFVERFLLHEAIEELQFVESMLDADLRNNSAWTHRFYLKFGHEDWQKNVDLEIEYAKLKIEICPQNPSSWNYLKGIYRKSNRDIRELREFCTPLADVKAKEIKSSFALELLAEIEKAAGDKDLAAAYYTQLAEVYDPIRANYWNYVKNKL